MMIIPRRPAGRDRRLAACHVPLLLWLLHIIFTDASVVLRTREGKEMPAWRGS